MAAQMNLVMTEWTQTREWNFEGLCTCIADENVHFTAMLYDTMLYAVT